MAITSEDIQQQSFKIERRGYDVDEVDVFLEHVSDEIDALNDEIAHLRAQLAEAKSAPISSNKKRLLRRIQLPLLRRTPASQSSKASLASARAKTMLSRRRSSSRSVRPMRLFQRRRPMARTSVVTPKKKVSAFSIRLMAKSSVSSSRSGDAQGLHRCIHEAPFRDRWR